MNPFELDYRNFERLPQRNQLSTIFNSKIEEIFEILEIEYIYIYITKSHYMIEPIVNWNFGNKFQHQNGPNQRQNTQKNTIQQYQTR